MYSTAQKIATYQQVQTETATPAERVVLLYQGMVRFLNRALRCHARGDLAGMNRDLIRTQSILLELIAALDFSSGPEAQAIGENLLRLYDYCYRRLVEANLQKDPRAVEEVLGLLRPLLTAWEEVAQKTAGETLVAVR